MTDPQLTPAADSAASLRDERRAYVRVPSELVACCRPPGRGLDVSWPAAVRDVSRGGVGLLLRHRFRPGTRLEIEFRQRTGSVVRFLPARVVHASAVKVDGHPAWLIGCLFDPPLTDDEFQALR